MEKRTKIILGVAAVGVAYFFLRHAKVGINLGQKLSKLTNYNCGVLTTGGSGYTIYTNTLSCDAKKVCESYGREYVGTECNAAKSNSPYYTFIKETTPSSSSLLLEPTLNSRTFKVGDIYQGNFGRDYNGVGTVLIFDKYDKILGQPELGFVPAENLVQIQN
jgi:hypothetical protein